MITIDEVKQIVSKLSLGNLSASDDGFIEDISCIVYRNHVMKCGGTAVNSRHIDIEFSFGEYYEIHETTPAFRFVCTLCNFPLSEEEQELIIYQNRGVE